MAGSEPASEPESNKEPPSISPPDCGGSIAQKEDGKEKIGQGSTPRGHNDVVDDFGLPVKHVNTQSSSSIETNTITGAAFNSKAGGHGDADSQQTEDIGRPDFRESEEKNSEHTNAGPETLDKLAEDEGLGRSSANVNGAVLSDTNRVKDGEMKMQEAQAVAPVLDNVLHGNTGAASGWSHQALAPQKMGTEEEKREGEDWQNMPAYAPFDLYDDDGKLVAREAPDSDDEANAYAGLGGAGKGYTRVQIDDDAKSATSMDDNTDYLFKRAETDLADEDEEQRDPLAQLKATKDLLTEGQRIAYVGVTRLAMAGMVKELEGIETTKKTKKGLTVAAESLKMWSQKMMVRLYMHMEINSSEQVMIEQLAEHGVEPGDLTPALMQNARVKNPMARHASTEGESVKSPKFNGEERNSENSSPFVDSSEDVETAPLPEYREHEDSPMSEVQTPSQLGTSKNIDIDLRWTVLCDIFLVLLADSVYDSRSRVLLEHVGASLGVSWLEICRFEKRVTDSLEMQEAASKETWDEAEHMENRRKNALKRRYMMMGLATVGGSLVIGLSAGLLAPVIGAGLAAGFTTIGVAGTSGFLTGAGASALIASGGVVTGGTIGVRASNRRMGAVQTFEYRPLHNNKRVNLIVTVSGWMNGKVDDVRLPFSTVDPVMGDIYSVLWEPKMLQSMGDTINILATEALTQGLQQVLGSTILISLMAALQLPIVLTKLSYLIDNPWTVSMGRANAAGLILADSLVDRNLGVRPITLVGFSLGARVIFACLRELANKGAFGIIQNVYLFGSPIVANKDEYLRVRSVISGRFVNGYASNDWILGYLFRATSGGIMRVAGLAKVEGIHGLENVDVTKLVNGHMAYRAAMPRLLREVGWEVESDEFTEIEDPDPENHEKRQRELIHELDEARKDAEAKPEKKKFGFFRRGKAAEKKGWETYDDKMRDYDDFSTSAADAQGNVLFDIEAIKAELASEQIEVRQLESTLPPMKVNLQNGSSDAHSALQSPHSSLRERKSFDASMAHRPNREGETSQLSLPSGTRENPFDLGYDEYNLSAEAVNNSTSAEDSRLSFDIPVRRSSSEHSSRLPTPSPGVSTLQEEDHSAELPRQTSLRSSLSMPAAGGIMARSSPEHNAWVADPDEEAEEMGGEREVQLTFG